MVDVLTGFQRQNRLYLKFLPIEDGDQVVADILNVVTKTILASNNFESDETRVFEDTIVTGLGAFNIYLDYTDNLKGDIKVERFPWRDLRFGPHENLDLRDCEYMFKLKWFSKAKLKQLYPDEYEKIQPYSAEEGMDSAAHRSFLTSLKWEDAGGKTYGAVDIYGDDDLYDSHKKNYRVLERWQKEYRNVPVVVFTPTEEAENVYGMPKKDIKRLEGIEGIKIFYKETHKMRVVKTAGHVLLEDFYPDLAVEDFHIIPVFGKHYVIDDKLGFSGKVRTTKDPQRSINKYYSMILDNGNKNNNNLMFYDDDTFGGNEMLEQEFKENATKPLHIQKVNNLSKIPVTLPAPTINSNAATILEMSSALFQKISNVNAEMLGQESNSTSGRAILLRKQGALVGNEYLFDNLALAKRRLGKLLISMIQKVFTPERIVRIIKNQSIREQIKVTDIKGSGPLFEKYPPEAIEEMLSNTDLTKYDISVAESPYNPTTRQYIYWSLVEAGQNGAPIPPQMLIKHSEMTQADKDEAITLIEQQQMAAMQMEQQKINSEIQKSQIAAQSRVNNTTKAGS